MKHKIILASALTAMFAVPFAGANDLPGKGIKINPVQSTISEETFQTLIVAKALEELGYDVQPIKEVDYNVAYASIANGDATYLATSWVLYITHNMTLLAAIMYSIVKGIMLLMRLKATSSTKKRLKNTILPMLNNSKILKLPSSLIQMAMVKRI